MFVTIADQLLLAFFQNCAAWENSCIGYELKKKTKILNHSVPISWCTHILQTYLLALYHLRVIFDESDRLQVDRVFELCLKYTKKGIFDRSACSCLVYESVIYIIVYQGMYEGKEKNERKKERKKKEKKKRKEEERMNEEREWRKKNRKKEKGKEKERKKEREEKRNKLNIFIFKFLNFNKH